jgi:hypothetical protein
MANWSASIQKLKSILKKAGNLLHSEEFHAQQIANGNYITIGTGLGAKIVGSLHLTKTGKAHVRVAHDDNGDTWIIEDNGTAHKAT